MFSRFPSRNTYLSIWVQAQGSSPHPQPIEIIEIVVGRACLLVVRAVRELASIWIVSKSDGSLSTSVLKPGIVKMKLEFGIQISQRKNDAPWSLVVSGWPKRCYRHLLNSTSLYISLLWMLEKLIITNSQRSDLLGQLTRRGWLRNFSVNVNSWYWHDSSMRMSFLPWWYYHPYYTFPHNFMLIFCVQLR